jgi:hypothetical protein
VAIINFRFNDTINLVMNSLKVNGKGKVVPVLFLNRAPSHEGVLREWSYSSTICINHDARYLQ